MQDEKELWEDIIDFPNYLVSNFGNVVNISRGGSDIRPRPNQYGHIRVGLVRDGRQYTRALAPLVADVFVEKLLPHYNTPIHLDGDLWNCRADNLTWRPRWFAIRFQKQFMWDKFHTDYQVPLVDIDSGEVYDSVKEVCVANGLYWYDVVKSYVEQTFVPITYQEFRQR